jgi:cellulose synthase/poly-beta-1,6-N-acetylglucosamine synthase-like glycosyltransferase
MVVQSPTVTLYRDLTMSLDNHLYELLSVPGKLESILCFGAFFSSISIAIIALACHFKWKSGTLVDAAWSGATLISFLLAWEITAPAYGLIQLLAIILIANAIIAIGVPILTSLGRGLIVAKIVAFLSLATWIHDMATSTGWPTWVESCVMLIQILFFLFFFFIRTLDLILVYGQFTLRQPEPGVNADTKATDRACGRFAPKVSIQVPCYAEPPELVIQTLNAISRINYQNFEVLVIDNNTKDENLWRPVEAHCKTLGERFRFFHVDPISGAKAGALNFVMRHVAHDVELVAIIDADYIADHDFLEELVPLFAEPNTAYVQTPHDYREWKDSPFLSKFYSAYVLKHKLAFPARSLLGAAFTVGTMCIIRRRVLEEVGGWAEWCQTEDCELTVRIHAAGYSGHYVPDVKGRGLLPETLDRIRRQRFRWAFGPVQQLRQHWRLYFGLTVKSRLTFAQRFLKIAHSLEMLVPLLKPFMVLPIFFIACEDIYRGTRHEISAYFVAFLFFLIAVDCAEKVVALRLIGLNRFVDLVHHRMAGWAFSLAEIKAFVCASLGVKWPWQRTDKFGTSYSFKRAWVTSRTDIGLATCCSLAMVFFNGFATFRPFNYSGLLLFFLAVGLLGLLSSIYLSFLREVEFYFMHRSVNAGSALYVEQEKAK